MMPPPSLDRRNTSGKPRRQWRARRYLIAGEDIDAARELLGAVAPVEIRLSRYSYDTYGRLIGLRFGVWIIGPDTYLSPRQASLTLGTSWSMSLRPSAQADWSSFTNSCSRKPKPPG
jgi:hypothetical protein